MSRKQLDFQEILRTYLPPDELKEVKRILFGRSDDHEIQINDVAKQIASNENFEIKAYSFKAKNKNGEKPKIVRIGAIQNSIVLPTTDPVNFQTKAMHNRIGKIIKSAAAANANVLCLQETWNMPFGLVTGENFPWCEFAENAENGPTTKFVMKLAHQYNMVIISPILERDEMHGDILWNTAVVITNNGKYLGKHRKNHIPISYESKYYCSGNTGHPVFDTEFGKIAINICFGRQHVLNWMMFGLNGAEIVFNPAATIMPISGCWMIQARNAAMANSYYTVAINRVGMEYFGTEFTTGSARRARSWYGPFYGSSFITAPDGTRTPSLSTKKDGLILADIDLNLCQEMKQYFALPQSQNIKLYAEKFTQSLQPNYRPEIIKADFL